MLAVGSSEFIKRKFGEGYNLKVTFNDASIKSNVSNKVNQHIQNCEIETEHSNENQTVFNIPFSAKKSLGKLFYELE